MERQTLIAKRVLEWPWDEGANRTRDLFEMARAYRTILPGMVRKAVALAAFSFLRQTEPFNAHLHLEHFEVADLKYVLHGDFLDEAQNDELKPKQVTPYLAAVSGDVNLKPLIEFVSVVTHEQHLAQIDGLKAGKGQALNLVASLCKALQLSDRPQLAIRPSLDAIKHPAASSRARHILGPRLLGILPPAQVDSLYDQLFEWIVAKHASEDFDIKVSVFKTVTEMLRLPYLSRDATFSRLTQLGELSGHIDIQHGICKWVLQDLTKSTEPISDATWSLVDSFVTMANGIVEGVSFTEEKWHAFEDGTAELPEVESNQRIKASLLGMKPEDAPDLSYTYAKRVIAPLALNTTINKRRYISTFLKASGIELDTPLQVTQGVSVEDVQDWIPGLPLSLLDIFESQATAHVLDSQFARWKSDLSRHNERWNDTPGGKQLSHIEQGMASTTAFTTLVSALFNEGLQPSDEHLISVKSMQDLLVSVGTKLLQNPRSIAGHHPLEHIRTLLTTLGPNVAQRAEWSIRARPVIERIAAAYESLVLESGPAIKPHRLEIAILLLPFPSHPPFSEKADSCAVFAHALADLITSLVDEDPDVYHVHLPLLMKLAEQNYFLAQDIFPVARALTSLTEGGLRVRVIRHQWAHRLVTAWSGSLTELEKTELIEMWKQDESPLISALGYAHLLS
ncbi:hypothetical protein BOTBODRAFT_31102 [Botryobasidium botryosum FD-172 SS1]|uniref:Uncharacterized protein n=1 Tax=Botryobasidium botryosum (strain FD-172 SS1) TaxID=930990 RepID=A0A067MJR5_BOTB1|nr:hypothetical protein BOTBODRAFT_31102 [Botryobasidium botryosum FD-172 SS1]